MLMSGAMTNPDTSLLGTAEGLVGSLASLTAVPGGGGGGGGGVGGVGGGGGGGGGGQQKDTTWTKLFVGGLPYHTTDKSLRDHFAVYGDIEEAVVITDRQSGKSRGYGFVSIIRSKNDLQSHALCLTGNCVSLFVKTFSKNVSRKGGYRSRFSALTIYIIIIIIINTCTSF